ncbi:hypothetical protein AZE42_09321 [Rhizopogon vesiculosus]|uniref:Uncharacterized protein n=1 Tax=Rhizopogon vesiculosus TaxID=180088 RepID=A0A1J8QTM8_9AGAM|nr:hypothetical protein AZE42_09321 [Rhizopogon vesiculosus]
MSTIQIQSLTIADDVSYHYLDSGAVSGITYTTFVFIHGMGFNAGVFRKLLPLAAAHDLRIVCLYRRDYDPTTSFRDRDLASLTSGTVEEKEGFLRSQAVEIATFLVKFALEKHLPPAQGTSGGIALIGWSMGALHTHAVVAYLDALASDVLSDLGKYLHTMVSHGWSMGALHTHAVVAYLDALASDVLSDLGKYLHTMVSHDVGAVFLGIANPPEYNIDLWFEPDTKTRFNLFYEWATAYFHHKSVVSGNINDLEFNTFSEKPRSMHELSSEELAELTSVKAFGGSDTLLVSMQPDTHSMHELSSEELAELTSVEAYGGSDTLLLFYQLDVFKNMTRRVIFNAALAQKFLPNLRVRYMSGGASPGVMVWALSELRKSLADPKPMYGPDAERARDVKVICYNEGNHFNFWDEPQAALSSYLATVNL